MDLEIDDLFFAFLKICLNLYNFWIHEVNVQLEFKKNYKRNHCLRIHKWSSVSLFTKTHMVIYFAYEKLTFLVNVFLVLLRCSVVDAWPSIVQYTIQ